MIKKQLMRGRTLILLAAVVAPMAFAAPALALEPTGDFAVFKQCPRFTTGVELCLFSQTKSGEVVLNKQKVPILNTITLQGGVSGEGASQKFVGALNGETLSKTPQNVPGGLTNLINCTEITGSGFLEVLERASCKLVFENKTTGVQAITELAKPASEIGISTENLETRSGTALKLPIKVRLENTFLGSECYIGSSSSPITLNLTTGTTAPNLPNKPISGKVGTIIAKDTFEFLEISNNTLVDNAFSAPGATGCGGIFAFLLDPIINSKIGLPAANGLNTAIQNNTIKEGTASGTIESEK